ncbi:hypothetical protein OHD60_23705 [Escherichia coli]|nr:hypothetical protein [Escherichia coli]
MNIARLIAYGILKVRIRKSTVNTALNKADLFKSTTVTSSNEDLKVSTEAGAAPRYLYHQRNPTGAGALTN